MGITEIKKDWKQFITVYGRNVRHRYDTETDVEKKRNLNVKLRQIRQLYKDLGLDKI